MRHWLLLLCLLLVACGAPAVADLPPAEQQELRQGQNEIAALLTGVTKAHYGQPINAPIGASWRDDLERAKALALDLKERFGSYQDAGDERPLAHWFDRRVSTIDGFLGRIP